MSNKIKIVSGGHSGSTKVFAGNTELKDITQIKINPIIPDGFVSAQITFNNIELDVVAELVE